MRGVGLVDRKADADACVGPRALDGHSFDAAGPPHAGNAWGVCQTGKTNLLLDDPKRENLAAILKERGGGFCARERRSQ